MDDIEDSLQKSIASMNGRDDFAHFMTIIISDYEENAQWWNNQDLYSFICALAKYSSAPAPEQTDIDAEQPSWRLFADMIAAARSFMLE